MKKIFKILLLILILSGCTPNMGGSITETRLQEVSPTIVTKTGNFHYFKDIKTNEVIKEEITEEEYETLGLKDAGQPEKIGYKWVGSAGNEIVETAPRVLLDYQYYNDGLDTSSSTMIKIKMPNKGEETIKKDCIINNKLSEICLEK